MQNQWYYIVIRILCKKDEAQKDIGKFKLSLECLEKIPIQSNKLLPTKTSYKNTFLITKKIVLREI